MKRKLTEKQCRLYSIENLTAVSKNSSDELARSIASALLEVYEKYDRVLGRYQDFNE